MLARSIRLLASVAAAALVTSGAARAKVVDFRIVETTSPAFGGTAFGEVGAYERVDAVAEFAIDWPGWSRGGEGPTHYWARPASEQLDACVPHAMA